MLQNFPSVTANDQPPEEPSRTGGFPEVRLKPGFKSPGRSSDPEGGEQAAKERSPGPLSFDEMLQFTSRPSPKPAPPPLESPMMAFAVRSFLTGPIKVMIKSKPSAANVYLAEEHLGETPLEVELPNLDERPVLKLVGYKNQPLPGFKMPEGGEAGKVYVELEKVPFPVDWSGLAEGTRVWLDGAETRPDKIVAGDHKVKVKPPGQSSFFWTLTIPWNNGEEYAIGHSIAKEVQRRPVLKVSLSGATRADVIVKDGPRFTTVLSLGKTPKSVTLPGKGKYQVIVKGTHQHGSFKKEITLKDGSKKSLAIALWQPTSAPARVYQRRSSRVSPPSYDPPPSYPSSGSGGGGRIAPPSF